MACSSGWRLDFTPGAGHLWQSKLPDLKSQEPYETLRVTQLTKQVVNVVNETHHFFGRFSLPWTLTLTSLERTPSTGRVWLGGILSHRSLGMSTTRLTNSVKGVLSAPAATARSTV